MFVILSNINIGGEGSFALPGPNNFPSAQSINSSIIKAIFFRHIDKLILDLVGLLHIFSLE